MKNYEFHLTRESLIRITGASEEEIVEYEKNGLLPIVAGDKPQTRYRPNAIETIRFIRMANRLGFSIEDVSMMIFLIEIFGGGGDYVGAVIHDHILSVRDQISRLLAMEKELINLESRCLSDLDYLAGIASAPQESGRMQA